MGISKIFDLIKKKCPKAITEKKITDFKGSTIAIDASMVIYQFVIATQMINKKNNVLSQMSDEGGNLTGHLMGILQRNVFFLQNGIKPVWVFDGEAPTEKSDTLKSRVATKNLSLERKKKSIKEGNHIDTLKYAKRSVYISQQMKKDSIELIKLLGLPCVISPSEGEAQCSVLARGEKVYGVATEDFDSLTFGAKYLLRQFNIKNEIIEISLQKVLESLQLSMEQYIDLCILSGCDYCGTISSIGPVTAYKFIQKYKNIENVLDFITTSDKAEKYKYDPIKFNFKQTRKLFAEPAANKDVQLKWVTPNLEEIKYFMHNEKRFGEARVDKLLEKLKNTNI